MSESMKEQLDRRAAKCVAACAGISNPGEALKAAREALRAISVCIGSSEVEHIDCRICSEAYELVNKALALLGGKP